MHFVSFHFLVFFFMVYLAVRYVENSGDLRKNILLLASYYFYMCWDWRLSSLLLLTTIINYIGGVLIARTINQRQRRLYLAFSLSCTLGMLAYFKYFGFFVQSFESVLNYWGISDQFNAVSIILPLGISFYTFQGISYVLDIYLKRAEPISSFRDFALFVAFFPQLVAGPIVRASYFLPQLSRDQQPVLLGTEGGLALLVRGFIKKIALADVLAIHLVDPAFQNPTAYSPLFLLLALYGYSFQVYLDFSGYTDIARGTAKMLGYELPVNFQRPYMASSISEFWQRWHISMSSFFRDYLYHGLGGSRAGNVYLNILITFVCIGLWHGAGWNFILYGLIHGSLVGWERYCYQKQKRQGIINPKVNLFVKAGKIFLTFNIVAFARILFRGGSLDGAMIFALALINFSVTSFPFVTIGFVALGISVFLHYTPEKLSDRFLLVFSQLPVLIQSGLIICCIYFLSALASTQAPFVYFQF